MTGITTTPTAVKKHRGSSLEGNLPDPRTIFARFYDRVSAEPSPRLERVRRMLVRRAPTANALIELACGTGTILAGLDRIPSQTGIDVSVEMLAIAKQKVPEARLVCQDMVSFDLGERFDVVICVHDALNLLLSFDLWEQVFDRVADHLVPGGVFFIDVTTLGGFRRLARIPSRVRDAEGVTVITDATMLEKDRCSWDFRYFELQRDRCYELHQVNVVTFAPPINELRLALSSRFELLDESNLLGTRPTDESQRAFFTCRLPATGAI